MHQRWTLLVGLWAGVLVGCATGKPVNSTSLWERVRPFHGPTGPDVVTLDVAVIELLASDRYFHQELWQAADEQVVALECKALLEDNGFRVGQIGGLPPPRFQTLLTSDRTCVHSRRHMLHAGHPTTVVLGPAVAKCAFQVHLDGQAVRVNLENAQCALEVVPTLTSDGLTRLQFTPQIQYGKAMTLPGPSADRSCWIFQEHRPTERYPALGWEVTLGLNEYAVVCGRYDRPETLGHCSFVRTDEVVPMHRLLAVRASRVSPGVAPDSSPEVADEDTAAKAPSLALQAAMTAVRGDAP